MSAINMQPLLRHREVLHVEVALLRTVNEDLTRELLFNIRTAVQNVHRIRLGTADIDELDLQQCHRDVIQSIEYDYSGPLTGEVWFDPKKILSIDTRLFMLFTVDEQLTLKDDDGYDHFRVMALPNATLKSQWTSLVFEDNLHAHLLRVLVRGTLHYSALGANETHARSRLCLLHGPPGSGKSVTCRALAQKLSIRLRPQYSEAILVELSATSLFSKYFGETPRLVDEFFAAIEEHAKNPQRLICVVIDEVDAIGGERVKVQNDCRDDARATISLLTGLDRIQMLPQVIVFATSNIKEALDPAFVDRTDETLTKLIPLPSIEVIYELLRRGVTALEEQGLVERISSWVGFVEGRVEINMSPDTRLPGWATMMTFFKDRIYSLPYRLWKVAEACEGKSARKVSVLASKAFDTAYGGLENTATIIEAMEKVVGINGSLIGEFTNS